MWPVAAILFGVYIPLVHAVVPGLARCHYLLLLLAVHPSIHPSVRPILPSDPQGLHIRCPRSSGASLARHRSFSPRSKAPPGAPHPRASQLVVLAWKGSTRRRGQDAGSDPQGEERRAGEAGVGEGGGAGGEQAGAGGGGLGGAARRDAGAEAGRRAAGRRAVAQRQARAHHPRQGQARRRHARDLHQLRGVLRGAEEAGGGQDGAAPGRPEGAVQGQGARLQGVPRHGRRQGPLQARRRRGPRGQGAPAHRGAPQRAPREGRQGSRRGHRRGRQARAQGGGAGRIGAQGGEGGGERRGAGDGAAHERAAQARRGGRRRRRQGAEADAGEARAEVRGDARRGGGQERRHHPQIQREGRRQAAAAAAGAASAAAATKAAAAASASVQSPPAPAPAAGGGADAVGDVRPAVVAAVHVLGFLHDHRELDGVLRRAADEPAGLDALLTGEGNHPDDHQRKRRGKWESERGIADAMLVCQGLHPWPAEI